MLLSTAIPMVMAAIVIVIISKGIPNKPMIPNIKKAAIKFGTTPIKDNLIFLNSALYCTLLGEYYDNFRQRT